MKERTDRNNTSMSLKGLIQNSTCTAIVLLLSLAAVAQQSTSPSLLRSAIVTGCSRMLFTAVRTTLRSSSTSGIRATIRIRRRHLFTFTVADGYLDRRKVRSINFFHISNAVGVWSMSSTGWPATHSHRARSKIHDVRLRWIYRNAKQWNFDTSKIVLTGHSAGGHLSLITGMLPDGTPLDNRCYGDAKYGDVPMKVAAIVNWYGISDVNDLIAGSESEKLRGDVDGYSAERRRGRKERFAADVCPGGSSADHHDPRRQRRCGPVCARDAFACRIGEDRRT